MLSSRAEGAEGQLSPSGMGPGREGSILVPPSQLSFPPPPQFLDTVVRSFVQVWLKVVRRRESAQVGLRLESVIWSPYHHHW